jgi:DNA-binding phage protein
MKRTKTDRSEAFAAVHETMEALHEVGAVDKTAMRDFRETIKDRASREPAFREALLREAAQLLLDGDAEGGRAALRTCINATAGFDRLGEVLGRPPKSLMRMFGPEGNPTAENLLAVLHALQAETGVHLEVRAVGRAA